MRRIVTLSLVGLLLACQSAEKQEGPAQYRAWCWSESKPLGDWTFDRAAAEEQLKKHERIYPHHRANIKVWRGKVEATGAKAP